MVCCSIGSFRAAPGIPCEGQDGEVSPGIVLNRMSCVLCLHGEVSWDEGELKVSVPAMCS